MSSGITLQSDVGSLGLAGLGAFASVLSAMSTDNVAPMAMVQIENLGSLFHVNGSYASRIPQLLTRAVSHPVGRLSLSVGWRRGDAISLLAETAGGQAISLLATALVNLYDDRGCGMILAGLCSSLLPKSFPTANQAQMYDIAKLIAAKAAPLAFGNLLAQEAHRVISVYEQLSINAPKELLYLPTEESVIDLLECLSHLRDEKHIVRVSGSIGILYVATIILFMFPQDTMVSVETLIIRNTGDPKIFIEICSGGQTCARVERKLSRQDLLVGKQLTSRHTRGDRSEFSLAMSWDGWVTEAMRFELAKQGLALREDHKESMCTFIYHAAMHLKLSDLRDSALGISYDYKRDKLSRKSFKELVGPSPAYRIRAICERICHSDPTAGGNTAIQSWQRFYVAFLLSITAVSCGCGECNFPCDEVRLNTECPRGMLLRSINSILTTALLCFLVEPSEKTITIGYSNPGFVSIAWKTFVSRLQDPVEGHGSSRRPHESCTINSVTICSMMSDLIGGMELPFGLGISNQGTSIYPAVLETVEIEHTDNGSPGLRFHIKDGHFVHVDSYFTRLRSDQSLDHNIPQERFINRTLGQQFDLNGGPLSLKPSTRPGYRELLIRFSVISGGSYFSISADQAIVNLANLVRTGPCGHDPSATLEPWHASFLRISNLTEDSQNGGDYQVFTTRGDRVAQFVACALTDERRPLLLMESCINCAIQKAADLDLSVIVAR